MTALMTDVPVERLEPISGRAHGVSVRLTDLTVRQTTSGRRYPYSDFGTDFIEALNRALVTPRRRGLIRSKLVCPSCEASLEGVPVATVPVTTEIALARIPPILVDLEMPGLECPGCHRALVNIDDRAVESDLSDALIDAFKSVGLVPG
jgi:hypothetical protein